VICAGSQITESTMPDDTSIKRMYYLRNQREPTPAIFSQFSPIFSSFLKTITHAPFDFTRLH
jgi:hypothetical protein